MKKLQTVFICIVLAAFIVPSALMLFGFKNANRENRPLAKLPELVGEDGPNTEFASEFDDYVDDHFALREYLVTAFNAADIALLRDFNGTNAVIGKSNHIFYAESVNDYLGTDQLTEKQIESVANYLFDLQTRLGEKGASFAFMTAPNKASIYPEYMPDYLKPTENAHNIDMLAEALKAKGVNYIDAKALLLEAKEKRTVYYEHDSHWNNYGAMLVYNEIADHFGLEKYDAEVYTTVFDRTGDLHNFVYPSTEYPEERIVYPEFHKYSSRRPINMDRDRKTETTCDADTHTMVVLHDSFGKSLQPILSQSAGKLYMNSSFPYNVDYVESAEPDMVLIELVERNLDLLYEHAASLGY
ncbi:MAG: hypothetical protein IKQ36_05900 [Clostridia bacterium]|nr:hypothetical protein [Clostridia bacterium]